MTSTTHAYFDLFSAIKGIASPEIAAPTAQSTAWKIDALIIQSARQIYRGVKDHYANSGLDARAELTLALNEQAFAESCFDEIGSSMTGPITTIKELMFQREAWIALAVELTPLTLSYTGQPKVYEHKDLESSLFEIGPMKVNSQFKSRAQRSAKRNAEAFGMPEEADRLYQSKLARKEISMAGLAENLKDQAQGVAWMMYAANRADIKAVDTQTTAYFSSLTLPTQRELINNAVQAAARALDWAADNRSLTEADYDMADLACLKFTRELQAVLKSSRFANAAQQEAAAAANLG